MARTKETKKATNIQSDKDFSKLIEGLDEKSKVLAKTYISALTDRQLIENAKMTAVG